MRRLEQVVTVLTMKISLPDRDAVYSGILLIRADFIRSNLGA
jgi:hypothetical protein